jgi:hypothetical protein
VTKVRLIMTQLHLRHSNRYPLAVPVSFWWSDTDKSIQAGEGVTQDISSGGVLVAAPSCPPDGARIHLEIRLPRLQGSGYGMALHGEGLVVRVEPGKSAIPGEPAAWFAVAVQFYPERADAAEELRCCVAENMEATYLN